MSEDNQTPPPQEEEAPMGACPLLRYKPNDFLKVLEPHEQLCFKIEGMLLWQFPIPMAITLAIVELIFIFVGVNHLGFLSVLSMLIAFRTIGELLYKKFGDLVSRTFFPANIQPSNEGESNRIYPLLPFCQRASYLCSVIYIKVNDAKQALADASNKTAKYIALGVAIASFFFFWVAGSFWPTFILVNLILLLPGIVMHPKVFPYSQPYFNKFASVIGCPYCHPKTE